MQKEIVSRFNVRSVTGLVVIVLVASIIWMLRPEEIGSHYGAWSLLPAFITIAVCFFTRNVLLALLLGIFTGGLVVGNVNIISEFLVPSLGTEKYAQILLVYLWALGGLLGLWNRNGGALHFAESMAGKFVSSKRSAKLFTWVMGVVFHQGGTISTVLTGTTVRPIADKFGVSHEELSYVVDSTASPVATLIPFNVWPVYVAGLIVIEPLSGLITTEGAAIELFLQAIPYNFYAWIAVAMTLLFSIDRLPLLNSPMARAVDRVRDTGKLNRDGAEPMASLELTQLKLEPGYAPSSLDFLGPIGVLMGFCILPWILGGSPLVFEGFGMAVVTGLVLSVARGMAVASAFDAMVTGIKGVTVGAIVLGLAVTLATVSETLGTSAYVIDMTLEWLQQLPFILPALLLLICMLVSFSIGSSWGTYAVVFPVALPLAFAISPEPAFVLLSFGAILGGAVFGDQCSPISDTTILSSLACGADLMDHVATQLPLAMTAAGLAALLYLLAGYLLV